MCEGCHQERCPVLSDTERSDNDVTAGLDLYFCRNAGRRRDDSKVLFLICKIPQTVEVISKYARFAQNASTVLDFPVAPASTVGHVYYRQESLPVLSDTDTCHSSACIEIACMPFSLRSPLFERRLSSLRKMPYAYQISICTMITGLINKCSSRTLQIVGLNIGCEFVIKAD